MKHWLSTAVVFGGLSLLSVTGCANGGGGYYARVGPPPPRYGVMGYAPGPGYVWTDGYYDYRGGRYNWVQGNWRRPPRSRSQWVPGQWTPHNRGYRFRRGYWR
jgi:hypothetical protein